MSPYMSWCHFAVVMLGVVVVAAVIMILTIFLIAYRGFKR